MSVLLIHENPLMVLPSLAVAVGLNEAIVLQQVHYWITRADKPQVASGFAGRLKGGRRWIYNNYEDWQVRNFPFWSVSTIRRAIRSLENRELLISEVEPDITCPGGKRKWYTINYDKLAEIESVQNDQTLYSTWTDPSVQNEQAYNIESETTTEITDIDSADTPNGGQRHVVEHPTPERQRDLVFETVIARNFGVALDDKAGVEAVRDKANWITSWLKGNAVKKNSRDKLKTLPGCSPPASPEEVGAFYDWWEREKGIDKPGTALGIAQFMSVFRQERTPARTGPAIHFPKPQYRCTVCGDSETGAGATGMQRDEDGKSVPCPACLAAEQAAQEVRDEQAA